MKAIQRNIPIFGTARNSFLNVIKQYSDQKVAYDGVISLYGQVHYRLILPSDSLGTVPIRHQISFKELLGEFNIVKDTPEAIGLEFDIPIRKGFRANLTAELWSWDNSERLASFETKEVFYNSPTDKSDHPILYKEGEDEYVFTTIVLNQDKPSDLYQKSSFLQNKIKRWIDNRSVVSNRLFLLRVKQFVWPANGDPATMMEKFECREDNIVLDVLS
ncbi:MAG: hypothetical protein HRU41_31880 [Saprospiraceae bacterium]|nr:hypothetical protein [Saprospiraceae bacterium]